MEEQEGGMMDTDTLYLIGKCAAGAVYVMGWMVCIGTGNEQLKFDPSKLNAERLRDRARDIIVFIWLSPIWPVWVVPALAVAALHAARRTIKDAQLGELLLPTRRGPKELGTGHLSITDAKGGEVSRVD